MEWSKGYSSTFYLSIIDKATWRDVERFELLSGSIKRDVVGLRESATLDCIDYPFNTEQWIRIWMDIKQGGSNEHIPLFTGLATSPEGSFNGNLRTNTVDCYSVLKPAADIALLRGWYAPAGMNGARVIANLLSVIPAPVSIAEDAPALTNHVIAEDKETHLSMVEKILVAINWRMKIGGDGVVSIEPYSNEPVATFDPLENDVLETQIQLQNDWFDCPNVLLAIDDDLSAVARDDSLTSPLSTVNRGREVWKVENNCELADDESIEQYAQRRLAELQQVSINAKYSRRYMPNVFPTDAVRLKYPKQDLNGIYKVQTQNIKLGTSARTSEEIINL